MADIIEEIIFMQEWAAKNNAQLVLKGEAGFGRECVGISAKHPDGQTSWPDFDYHDAGQVPPPNSPDAYHKHDCLCVLGRSEYAVQQLAEWVHNLDAGGYEIAFINRPVRHSVDQIMHGKYLALLNKPGMTPKLPEYFEYM